MGSELIWRRKFEAFPLNSGEQAGILEFSLVEQNPQAKLSPHRAQASFDTILVRSLAGGFPSGQIAVKSWSADRAQASFDFILIRRSQVGYVSLGQDRSLSIGNVNSWAILFRLTFNRKMKSAIDSVAESISELLCKFQALF